MISISIKGSSELQLYFKTRPQKIMEALSRGLKGAALLIERESKIVTPVDTGRLRGSIFSTIHQTYATVQPNTDYAIYVHEGTRFMSPRPFMAEGTQNAAKDIEDLFSNEIKKALQ